MITTMNNIKSNSSNKYQRATTNNNKYFNYKRHSIYSGSCILEEFFSSGHLPAVNTTDILNIIFLSYFYFLLIKNI